ncbi:serine threonine-protein phosphatase 2a activator 1 [Ophiostoma piceae UAMH 11346]|uniref:Serine/threonine-protein phosphatase 2A activator n=1 Tax=Ophiostoma piceae (strain UAMH 11346) TaxID=1262450 RepID=S3C391_OPHP1|nr:serine threonine-protein phosphatase 2a activator 1 [Ophiostoma piceae UAMH 11346]
MRPSSQTRVKRRSTQPHTMATKLEPHGTSLPSATAALSLSTDPPTLPSSPQPLSQSSLPRLGVLQPPHDSRDQTSPSYIRPAKRIHEGPDVARFLVSKAYRDIGLFILQLNHAMCPRTTAPRGTLPTASTTTIFTLPTDSKTIASYPSSVQRLRALLARIASFIDEAPPDPGPRRFGNVSFRIWHELVNERVKNGLIDEFIILEGDKSDNSDNSAKNEDKDDDTAPATARDEIKEYFLGSFGSAQRLDFGTGHELSFLAFLGCLWKLGVFADGDPGLDGEAVERSLVLGVIEPYLNVVRKLILTYTLEPAGSHGVWGLDDHFFLPYIFGSAQLARPISGAVTDAATGSTATTDAMPLEGSAPRVPKPSDIAKPATVEVQRQRNLYFSAVGFINDVKRGPFWEHSPILYDVSGIKDGWGKINKGMIKMFNAEVLSKFPVVQHFPFGSLFSWDEDPEASAPAQTVHMANQPLAEAATAAALQGPRAALPSGTGPTPALPPPTGMPSTAAPWAQATRMPGAAPGAVPGPGIPYSRVPAAPSSAGPGMSAPGVTRMVRPGAYPGASMPPTRAPFAHPSTGGGGHTDPQNPVTKAPWAP